MSTLIDGVHTAAPVVDPRLKDQIAFAASSEIPKEIIDSMTLVLFAIAQQLEKEGKTLEGKNAITCIFIGSDRFEISLDPEQIAICMKLAVYPLPRLVPFIGKPFLYAILAEELCHLIWEISDEVIINDKVVDVLRNIFPNLTKESLGYAY